MVLLWFCFWFGFGSGLVAECGAGSCYGVRRFGGGFGSVCDRFARGALLGVVGY